MPSLVQLGSLGGATAIPEGLFRAFFDATPAGLHAFRWTSATGMVDLGTLGDENRVIEIMGMSADGSVIVGNAMRTTSAVARRPYRWTSATGMQDLNALLAGAGVNMTGITLTHAAGISENGAVIFGVGNFPESVAMPYIADFSR